MRDRRKSTGSEVIASTAGADTWKSWAGRSHGSEGFEMWDLFRGAKRKFNVKFLWGIPPAGTPCPVCFVAPESKEEWHITSSCGHAVCRDCLQGYASSLVRDPSHHGPLKCPVCPLPLRPKDAIRALCNDPELVKLWDDKIRDELLRALPGYRHCPRCNDTDNNNNKPLRGGGFVTPECLAPINHQREQKALSWLNHPLMKQQTLMAMYAVYLYFYFENPSTSIFVDILSATVVPFWLLRRIWLLGKYIAAFEARKALFSPITVECPCCDRAFILNAESEFGNNVIADEATEKWIHSNTRPCPRCSVPISKIEGCNHMKCSHCYSNFCWACMRLGTSCKAFNCLHGAPYGNAGIIEHDNNHHQQQDDGVLNRIDRIANESTNLDRRDAMVLTIIVIGFVARESTVVQLTAEILVKTFALIFSTGTIPTFIVLFMLSSGLLRGGIRRRLPELEEVMDGSAARRVAEELFDVDNAVERQMIADAIERSLVDR